MWSRAVTASLRTASHVTGLSASSRIRNSGRGRSWIAGSAPSDRDDEIPKVDFKGFGKRVEQQPGPPLIQALSTISKAQGKDVDTNGTKLVLGDADSNSSGDDVWRQLDSKVNDYPFERPFKVIGSGGEEFATSMVTAVETVLGQQVAADKVTKRFSSTGKYITVVVSVVVSNGDEVMRIYEAMRADPRMRYFL